MADYDHVRHDSSIARLALVLAVIALAVAWLAYNRSGKDLEDTVSDTLQSTTQEAGDAAQDAGQAGQDAADSAEDAADTGPDGVDDGAQ
jgi:hypothetical protein